jgi:hypothetical protein
VPKAAAITQIAPGQNFAAGPPIERLRFAAIKFITIGGDDERRC